MPSRHQRAIESHQAEAQPKGCSRGCPWYLRFSALLLAKPAALTAKLRIAAPSGKSRAGTMIWASSQDGEPSRRISVLTAKRIPKTAPHFAARHGLQRLCTRTSPFDEADQFRGQLDLRAELLGICSPTIYVVQLLGPPMSDTKMKRLALQRVCPVREVLLPRQRGDCHAS